MSQAKSGSKAPRVLIVDDKPEMAETVAEGLIDRGYDAVALSSSSEALARLRSERFDALVTDLRMPEVDGLGLLAASRAENPERPVLVMTAFGAVDSAVQSIREGAYHYLTKPFKAEELALFLKRALDEVSLRAETRALKQALHERQRPRSIIGRSASMREIMEVTERVAPTDASVLLLGETGTGKGMLAQILHSLSPRASKSLTLVNCAALPDSLLESELFGHVRGAFTGATADRAGLFSQADGGTLFLDEVGEMSPALQAKLLHVLETGRVRPVGSAREMAVDVRLIAATHRDLRARIREGSFREDLLYRLEVVSMVLPALRNRSEDLPLLIAHFLDLARRKHPGSPVRQLSSEAMARLLRYRWPGNVRELSHLMERLVLLGRASTIDESELPATVREDSLAPFRFEGEVISIRELHARYASWALEKMGGHKGRTAERLDIDGKTLSKWLGGGATE